jgi:hypothetical protein
LTAQSALDQEAQAAIREIGSADIVVGVPSYNNDATIGHVARCAAEGLALHFPDLKALLMNSDGGSSDATRATFMDTATSDRIHKLATCYQGTPGKGSAFRAIFEAVKALDARACVVVDSDLRSITPDWIRLLAESIVNDGVDYITPLYSRHKYDGTITNSLAYPLTRALYGKRVRQPIGGDFGFCGKLAASYLAKDVWESAAAQFGIDIFMTTTAVNEGFDVRQANLGAKIHDTKDPAASLGPMFRQVVGAMFALMGKYANEWAAVDGTAPTPLVGPAINIEPEPVAVTLSALIGKFKDGVDDRKPLWEKFVSSETLSEVKSLSRLDEDSFEFPATLWVRTVYEFAVAYNSGTLEPDEVVDSLTPIYFGRTAGFVRETKDMTCAEAEEVIESLATVYEREKPYLLKLWSGESSP